MPCPPCRFLFRQSKPSHYLQEQAACNFTQSTQIPLSFCVVVCRLTVRRLWSLDTGAELPPSPLPPLCPLQALESTPIHLPLGGQSLKLAQGPSLMEGGTAEPPGCSPRTRCQDQKPPVGSCLCLLEITTDTFRFKSKKETNSPCLTVSRELPQVTCV